MNHSQRIKLLAAHIFIDEPSLGDICELLETISDEFKRDERRAAEYLISAKASAKNLSEYLRIQGL